MAKSNQARKPAQIVQRSRGIANGVQAGYADWSRSLPNPREVKLDNGTYTLGSEIVRPPPSIGYQCKG